MNAETTLLTLEAASPDLAELRSIASDISRDTQRMTKHYIAFAVYLGKARLRRDPVNLNAVVEDALRDFRRRDATDREIVMQIELAPDLPMIIGDGGQL